jgi:hypothetical protein
MLGLTNAIEREKKHEPGRSGAFEKLSHVCGAKRLPAEKFLENPPRRETRPSDLTTTARLKKWRRHADKESVREGRPT